MITIHPIHDANLIKLLMKDEFDNLKDDQCCSFEQWNPYLDSKNILFLGIFNNTEPVGIVTLIKISGILAECHLILNQKIRGKGSLQYGKESIKWIRNNTEIKKLIGIVPEYNKKIMNYINHLGFKTNHIISKSYQKENKIYDCYLYELEV